MFIVFNFLTMFNASSQLDTARFGKETPGNDSSALLNPFLSDTVSLREAKIRPFKDYSSFKQAFINLEPGTSQMDSFISKKQLIKKQLEMGITPEMDAQSRFTHTYVQVHKQPQGIAFFSTEPGKGLPVIPLIRKITGRGKK
jgi:hypothetical protein